MDIHENTLSAAAYINSERNRTPEEGKRELLFGKLLVMAGASKEHSLIVSNLIRLLGDPLNEKGFEVVAADLRVYNPEKDSFVYPDLVVFHDEQAFFIDDQFDTSGNPSLIVEVVSPSTEAKDRGDKFRMYRAIESLTSYMLISQKSPLIEIFSRVEANHWQITAEDDLEKSISIPAFELEIPLKKVYRKVSFEENDQVTDDTTPAN